MGNHNQNETRCNPRENTNAGMPRPIANANPNGQNRKASEMNPSRQLWKFSDRVISPFQVLFAILCRLVLQLEKDFHTAMRVMPNYMWGGVIMAS